jgi:hypothetical protein
LLDQNYPTAVTDKLRETGRELQPIDKGVGDYLYDRYETTVKMPKGLRPKQFLSMMEKDLNGTIRNSTFDSINKFSTDPNPQIGHIYHIDILGPIDGDVILSRATSAADDSSGSFQFTTVTGAVFSEHPENGSREFGYEVNRDGSVTFYTAGASRPNNIATGLGAPIQQMGWESLIKGINDQIAARGGKVLKTPPGQRHRVSGTPPCENR